MRHFVLRFLTGSIWSNTGSLTLDAFLLHQLGFATVHGLPAVTQVIERSICNHVSGNPSPTVASLLCGALQLARFEQDNYPVPRK